ncbi:transferrin receptor protein 1-like isoform X1 [Xiphophorus maculatus]|uniref:Transferrin receptor 1b n=2 Tax=Xiphophorus maculatus TaxID=8083 RepID=A0A3B5QDX0_XIPMA|nr:transferrin receptor protein 1-like isoform X1 [Xiphophorus maculatus]
MDKIRAQFQRMMNGERYSRFTLQPSENGERHAEVNLSDYAADGDTAAEAPGSPSFRPAPLHHSSRTVAFIILGTLMVFLGGYLVGFISHHKPKVESDCGPSSTDKIGGMDPGKPSPTLSWKDVSQLLTSKLSSEAFKKTLKDFDLKSRSAGSEEDMSLANRIFDTFKTLGMTPWTDIHYVQLQTPDTQNPNTVHFGSDIIKPVGYLAYSKPGKVEGRLVYGNYGRQKDLDFVQGKVDLKGAVLLLRAGKIPFAQQVDNGAKMGAHAVLIYLDTADYKLATDTELYGHVHLGSGDPYTPGFPSFNHTLFAPMESAGLPEIPAQTITASSAAILLKEIGGPEVDTNSDFKGELKSVVYKLGGSQNITVEVNNVLVNKEIHNVFGVIKGFTDPDRYVVLGAQRDAWGRGYTKATVGTSVLIELAKAFQEMVKKDDFRPRRSIIFASWSAGEFGSVGATEWLEGYMSSLDRSVFTYINLDGVVMGQERFIASASPLLYSLIESTMKEVNMPRKSVSIYQAMGGNNWESRVLRTMSMEDPAYPFLAFAGIPSMCFHFIQSNSESYPYYGTSLDNMDHLNYRTSQRTSNVTATAAQFAGLMTLRLVHDHLLGLDVSRYYGPITKAVVQVYKRVNQLTQSGQLKDVSPNWLNRARGSYRRAADAIAGAIANTDLTDEESCRILNDRIMKVEHSLLSPYVSVVEAPFRHLLLGRGPHTLAAIAEAQDLEKLRLHLALATWNLQGCANAMAANVWDIDDDI